MTKPVTRWLVWKIVSCTLVVLAIVAIVVEPFGKGPILVSITKEHGIDVGDIPAIVLLLAAAGIMVVQSLRSNPRAIDD
jgi:hypothetical protein